MIEDVEIADLQISPPEPVNILIGGFTEQRQTTNVHITIKNNSKNTTYYIISSLRSLRYDSATFTLFLDLAEPSSGKKIKKVQTSNHRTLPPTIAILPMKSVTLSILVPLVFSQFNPLPEKSGADLQVFDISGLKQVVCTLAYNKKPFDIISPKSAEKIVHELNSWSHLVSRKFAGSVPFNERKGNK